MPDPRSSTSSPCPLGQVWYAADVTVAECQELAWLMLVEQACQASAEAPDPVVFLRIPRHWYAAVCRH